MRQEVWYQPYIIIVTPKGKKAVGKGNAKYAGDDSDDIDDATNEQKQRALDSQMQRLKMPVTASSKWMTRTRC